MSDYGLRWTRANAVQEKTERIRHRMGLADRTTNYAPRPQTKKQRKKKRKRK